jgi:spermidine synthase
MGLEIVAGRLLAPAFGSSIYVWGAIIGVFLAALSLGYLVGGKRAATGASRRAIAAVFVGSAVFVAALILGGEWVVRATADLPIPQRYAPIVPITILFGPPTVLLGFVSPYAAELIEAESTGGASGHVYALGTIGSIVGAFATTFALIPYLGVTLIELIFGAVLIVAALGLADREDAATWSGVLVAIMLLGLAFGLAAYTPIGDQTLYQTQTAYQELRVADDDGIRTLYLDGVRHSAMDLDQPQRYVFEYTRYFHMPLLFRDDPDVDRVLFVGGGGFSGPKRYVHEYDATVDVVEIDPAVVGAAERYFNVSESDELNVYTQDGRVFLQETNRTYDVIVLDAYRSDQVPHHLTTVEFMRESRAHLSDDGVVVANVISARSGPGSEFYRAQYLTMQQVFPQVYSFPTSSTPSLQNIELVATVNGERVSEAQLRERNAARDIGIDLSGEIRSYRADVDSGDVPILRDDYAPVDRLLRSQAGKQYVVESTNETATASP